MEVFRSFPILDRRFMGKKDIPQKIFWEDNERFADLFNVVLGQGEIIVQPEDLTKDDTTISEVVKKENHKIIPWFW